MFEECLGTELDVILTELISSGFLRNFYLAGGTGLALQIGHRLSDDLDFFSPVSFEAEHIARELPGEKTVIVDMAPGTLHVLFKGKKLSFLYYPYRNLQPLNDYKGCSVAHHLDIAAMKLIAISQRGAKKDFVDLFTIIQQGVDLQTVVTSLKEKYPVRYSPIHILRSIAYFEDAEKEPMPLMRRKSGFSELTLLEWEQIKDYLTSEQKRLMQNNLA